MEHQRITPAAPLDGACSTAIVEMPEPPPARHDGWTQAKQAAFLRALAATHCVAEAARSVGMSRQSAYGLRSRLRGEPFDIAWQAAFRCKFDALMEAVVDRAIHGVEVPHFHKGELIHTSRRYDDRAAIALISLRERVTTGPYCYRAEDEGVNPEDFEELAERVEHGEELWCDGLEDDAED